MTSKAQQKRDDRDAAITRLREMFPPGSNVTAQVTHVSQSGMQRAVQVLHGDEYGKISDVSWLVARAMGGRLHRSAAGVVVNGCGMDMRFHLIYTLAWELHQNAPGVDPTRVGYALTMVGV